MQKTTLEETSGSICAERRGGEEKEESLRGVKIKFATSWPIISPSQRSP